MQTDISHIPSNPGVYLFKDSAWEILYIGKAKNLQKRVTQYFSPGSLWKQEMLKKAALVDFLVTQTESESLYLESNLIKKHKPFYNNMLKGGNGYIYIKLTAHPFPQIVLTRMKKHDKATYIGPKHNSMELRKLLQYLRYVLQFRTCGNGQFSRGVVCTDYHLGLCKGRCTPFRTAPRINCGEGGSPKDGGFCGRLASRTPNNHTSASLGKTDNYSQLMQIVTSFFKWNTKPIETLLLQQIEMAIADQRFERAARLRDIYRHIEQVVEKQHVELPKNISGYVIEIRQIWTWNVFVLLNFYEGRLIDVIRDQVAAEEGDRYRMIAGFALELGELSQISEQPSGGLRKTKGMKLLKSEQQALQKMIENAFDSYLITASLEGENFYNDLLTVLQRKYGLKNFPYRMECVDISHLAGDRVSGGLSCFVWGLPEKKGYRKYRINERKNWGDDYASLTEVVRRRLCKKSTKTEEVIYPSLMVIDGGKGQLWVVKKLYDESETFRAIYAKVDFIALGEGEAKKKSAIGSRSKRSISETIGEKVYRFDKQRNIVEIPLNYDQADKLLIKLRNEAHRFANVYRKQQMKL